MGAGPDETAGTRAEGRPWAYFGVGCFTFFPGLFGGAMIAVLIAKIVGFLRHCPADTETGAPCNWLTYAFYGAVIGAVLLPTVALMRMRRSRPDSPHQPRG